MADVSAAAYLVITAVMVEVKKLVTKSRPVLTDGRTASVQRRHEQCMDRRCWRIVAYPDITRFRVLSG
jgi:hypothetical protein